MTPVERALKVLRPVLGERTVERIRVNLPSRKPQLWEQFARALFKRTELAWRDWFDPNWSSRLVIAKLPEFEVVMELALRNRAVDLPVFQFGIYEISSTRFLQGVLKPGMTVVDVGANSGYYSLIAARLVGSEGHVYAFEPVAGPFEKLRRNVALNGFRNVTIIQSAVASGMGRSIVYPSLVKHNDGLGSLLPGPDRSTTGESIPVVSLDHVVKRLVGRRVHVIKVDVEGNEAEVFLGARSLLSMPDGPALLFESFDVDPIVASLGGFGYEVRHVHYSLKNGLEFPRVGDPFDNLFAAYEAPNYVAVKPNGQFGSFEELSRRNHHMVPWLLRLLAQLA
jgi:FkbM family methyltransferase